MITFLVVILFLFVNLAMVISNKSNFKILFSFLSSLVIFIFLNSIHYVHSELYLTFVTFMNFVTLGYIKFSQTGKVRVLPSTRNSMTNSLMPILSVLISTLIVIILLNNISDEILGNEILPVKENYINYFKDFNIVFVTGISLTVLFLYIIKRVKEL